MGWSIGSATPPALLGHPDAVPKDLYAKLEPYYRLLISYDHPHLTFGYDQPLEGYDPWTDPDYPTPIELFDNSRYWCSGYDEHPGRSLPAILYISVAQSAFRTTHLKENAR
ncbi:hypothetical protein OE88DRAFT_545399 [Heliocybe sulcata]|uniref:Uncharacterized protein n=1 Tax=Heliocybe sulcata TaxID=5364 RepID=A0A5C3MWJ4_9AGAM|nr:hypothetical protein OE88DRAFT_545399 [Heliocybe sulcata]